MTADRDGKEDVSVMEFVRAIRSDMDNPQCSNPDASHTFCMTHRAWLKLANTLEALTASLAAEGAGGWIAVTERMPDQQRMVLAHSPESQRASVQYVYYGYCMGFPGPDWFVATALGYEPVTYTGKPVTHWQPLPSAPGGRKGK